MLALLELWRRARPEGGRLHVFSVEAYPLAREDAARALAAFPEVAELAEALLAQWPRVGRGLERLDFPDLGATLDVALGEAADALGDWAGPADAWFLDGFAPAKNPKMWRDEVLDLVAARSAPGARLATFTVAGAVRRGLAARGFSVERMAGHGRKKERLEAWLPGAVEEPRAPSVAVIGAGIAGAALARAFRSLGVEPRVVDPAPGGGASGNPAALVSPRLDVGGGAAARLYAQAWTRAVDLYAREVPDAVIARGALRLPAGSKDPVRFEALAGSPFYRQGALQPDADGEGALFMAGAATVAPEPLLRRWLGPAPLPARVGAGERGEAGWRLLDEHGALLLEADVVCVATGPAAAALTELEPLEPVRGQATWSGPLPEPPQAASWGGYAVPTASGGVLFGATHQRGDTDTEVRAEDEARNLATLAERRPALAAAASAAGLTSRASVRAATRDRLPIAGEVAPGLFVLGGLGGRGFTTAPLLAEHVAALATGAPSPLPRPLAAAVDPGRFQARAGARRVRPPRIPQEERSK